MYQTTDTALMQWAKPRDHLASSSIAVVLACSVAVSSCGAGKSVPGIENFHAGVLDQRLYVSFVSTTLQWDAGLSIPIPGLEDALLSVAPDLQSLGTVFQFSIGINALLNGGKPLPLSALPDGRPIPDVRGGALPRWDAQIHPQTGDDLTLSLYLSNDAFGVFVPLKFVDKKGIALPWMVSVPINDERGNLLGKVYAIPPKLTTGTGSGLFVLLPYIGGGQKMTQPQALSKM